MADKIAAEQIAALTIWARVLQRRGRPEAAAEVRPAGYARDASDRPAAGPDRSDEADWIVAAGHHREESAMNILQACAIRRSLLAGSRIRQAGQTGASSCPCCSAGEREVFRQCTGLTTFPATGFREVASDDAAATHLS
ncbi:hypothetical protein [Bradyrhizobium neotropicale]|uniref:Uncharacterized protein n=1 Tax=Bradyrhizobium neotropicale TaxID=1497615 RepID=A0A176Z251_9BRAD|nr:hypothetical protein [Bradyrhizobium neotropicale]OAF14748.1 hypothetical protein AXW67_17445 [Bradyrhizobium neotropicale]